MEKATRVKERGAGCGKDTLRGWARDWIRGFIAPQGTPRRRRQRRFATATSLAWCLAWLVPALPAGLPAANLTQGTVTARIGIRVGPTHFDEFYDTRTGLRFIPRGNNYIRLKAESSGYFQLVTFDPSDYNPADITAALQAMKSAGYNVVRIWLDEFTMGDGVIGPGVSPAHMANVIDFLRQARAHDLYVVLTPGYFFPDNYSSIQAEVPLEDNVEGLKPRHLECGLH
jgi:hypothetical protein